MWFPSPQPLALAIGIQETAAPIDLPVIAEAVHQAISTAESGALRRYGR